MRQTIYIDTLISINLLVDYFLLYAAAQLAGRSVCRVRLCLAALIGGAYSCVILLPPAPRALQLCMAAAVALIMTLAGFERSDMSTFARTAGCLLLVTVCYGGAMTALWSFAAPTGLIINNGAVYINIPPTGIIIVTAAAYTVVTVCARFMRRKNLRRSRCAVLIGSGEKSVRLDAIIDTGNLLSEPFSGLPVIIAEYGAVSALLPADFDKGGAGTEKMTGVRVIPYSGIGGGGLMLAFKPERLAVEVSGKKMQAKAYIGVLREGKVGHGYSAIINPDAVLC